MPGADAGDSKRSQRRREGIPAGSSRADTHLILEVRPLPGQRAAFLSMARDALLFSACHPLKKLFCGLRIGLLPARLISSITQESSFD
ncbi:hypothetical protein HA46_06935 [Pantoea septica]|uniref:Transposase n=1 Tax=Pantoea septica TaxID=472695 RepID=A0ABX3UUB7_9GAMM|nr:hypothetical protein HA46_06935 [Pantoea septica]